MDTEIVYDEIVVCLFDGNYFIGLAALLNSLEKFKFKGLINAAYRMQLPPWINQLPQKGDNYFCLSKDITIHFQQVSTEMHLGYYKPHFIKETFENYPSANKIHYFDVDIVINAPWTLFSKWLEPGVSLCLDSNFHYIHKNHPWRKDWRDLDCLDEKHENDTNHYFNSGYMGIKRQNIRLINRWIHFTEVYKKAGGNIKSFEKESHLSFKGDQDLLNAAITVSADVEINVMGKEGMGFTLPATLMAHAIGNIKPWEKGFIKYLVSKGLKPNYAEKTFFNYCEYPIRIFSPLNLKLKKMDVFFASFLGRFLG